LIVVQAYRERAAIQSKTRKADYEKAVAKLSRSEIKEENRKRRILRSKYKSKSAKIIKDPNAPKRALSAFVRFYIENKEPGVAAVQGSAHATQLWKTMSDTEKQVLAPTPRSPETPLARLIWPSNLR
jgi:hypothetical protein